MSINFYGKQFKHSDSIPKINNSDIELFSGKKDKEYMLRRMNEIKLPNKLTLREIQIYYTQFILLMFKEIFTEYR